MHANILRVPVPEHNRGLSCLDRYMDSGIAELVIAPETRILVQAHLIRRAAMGNRNCGGQVVVALHLFRRIRADGLPEPGIDWNLFVPTWGMCDGASRRRCPQSKSASLIWLGRFLPRLGPLVHTSGPFYLPIDMPSRCVAQLR